MSHLRPFRALRPPKSLAATVAAPPYDVVSSEEARAQAHGNSDSFFRISRPEVDFPVQTDEHDEAVYEKGRENLQDFVKRKVLVPDTAPGFYLYRQTRGSHEQTGIVATVSVAEYEQGLIKKHELTRKDKEDDRARHVEVLAANDEPVFLAYRGVAAIDALVAELKSGTPEYDFTSADGIGHTVWLLDGAQTQALEALFKQVPSLYIADGHHRSAAAARVSQKRKSEKGHGQDFFLAVVFPKEQLRILDYNRVVRDLNALSLADFLERVGKSFIVEPVDEGKPSERHSFGMFLGGRWYRLVAKPGSWAETPVGALDVSILQDNLLGPILGIHDPRTDKRIEFVGGVRGLTVLERRVQSKEAAVAFAMFPTSMDELFTLADAGEIMPPKSTWFEPKLRSGLFVHRFDD
jgi:uncharacterized protein (DUF1015 family)